MRSAVQQAIIQTEKEIFIPRKCLFSGGGVNEVKEIYCVRMRIKVTMEALSDFRDKKERLTIWKEKRQ